MRHCRVGSVGRQHGHCCVDGAHGGNAARAPTSRHTPGPLRLPVVETHLEMGVQQPTAPVRLPASGARRPGVQPDLSRFPSRLSGEPGDEASRERILPKYCMSFHVRYTGTRFEQYQRTKIVGLGRVKRESSGHFRSMTGFDVWFPRTKIDATTSEHRLQQVSKTTRRALCGQVLKSHAHRRRAPATTNPLVLESHGTQSST